MSIILFECTCYALLKAYLAKNVFEELETEIKKTLKKDTKADDAQKESEDVVDGEYKEGMVRFKKTPKEGAERLTAKACSLAQN